MPTTPRTFAVACLALAAALSCQTAGAQSAAAVRAAVQKALQTNPEVTAKLHAFMAQGDALDAASAGWKPRVDLSADGGIDKSKNNLTSTQRVRRAGAAVTVSQVLWDGMATANEVDRVSHERLARWFELVDTTEQTSLEAARAVYDLQRYRRLVALADDNLAQHKAAVAKIESRVKAGVGRGVDLEQAKARLALAESNLESELANLHDVAVRYQRIVGDQPGGDSGALELLATGIPATASAAVQSALNRNPAIGASIESLRAARAAEQVRRSALQPKVEARARAGGGRNYGGVPGQTAEGSVEVVLNWNLYDGGADRGRVREQANLVNQAMDLRDKACRDVRQTVVVAYNDALKLAGQLPMLERNTSSIERARDAYRQQFDIGQRSLLDLLNAESEAYTARRALTNVEFDRAVAHARTHAALNQLNVQLGIARDALPPGAKGWAAGDDAAARCTPQALDMDALRASARPVTVRPAPAEAPVAAAPMPAPAPVALSPQAEAKPVRDPQPSPDGLTMTRNGNLPPAVATALTSRIEAWSRAMRAKDAPALAALYVPGFAGDEPSPQVWMGKQRKLLAQKGPVNVKVAALSAHELPDGQVETRFRQTVSTASFKDSGDKVLVWKIEGGQWLITKESSL